MPWVGRLSDPTIQTPKWFYAATKWLWQTTGILQDKSRKGPKLTVTTTAAAHPLNDDVAVLGTIYIRVVLPHAVQQYRLSNPALHERLDSTDEPPPRPGFLHAID